MGQHGTSTQYLSVQPSSISSYVQPHSLCIGGGAGIKGLPVFPQTGYSATSLTAATCDLRPLLAQLQMDVVYVGALTAAAFVVTFLAAILLAGIGPGPAGRRVPAVSHTSLLLESTVRIRVSSIHHPALCTLTSRLHDLRSGNSTCGIATSAPTL